MRNGVLTVRDLEVLELMASLESRGVRPTARAMQAEGVPPGRFVHLRRKLYVLGYLSSTTGVRGGFGYFVRTDRLREARECASVSYSRCYNDQQFIAAAELLIAEGVYPSGLRVAELVGCNPQAVIDRRKLLEASGRWPDWRSAGIKPSDTRRGSRIRAAVRNRKATLARDSTHKRWSKACNPTP